MQITGRERFVDTVVEQFRTRFTLVLIIIFTLISAIIWVLELNGIDVAQSTQLEANYPYAPLVALAVLLGLYIAGIQRSNISNVLAGALVLFVIFSDTATISYAALYLMVCICITLITSQQIAFLLALGALCIQYVVTIVLSIANAENADAIASSNVITFILTGIVGLAFAIAIRLLLNRIQKNSFDARRSATLLEASADIGQSMSQVLELDQLLSRSVEVIRDRFAFYHVQVFLVDDERDYAYLRASTGEVGEQMLARQHRLRVDSNSVVGRVAQAGEPIIARDTERSGRTYNELLPDTRSELGIPILSNQGIIGTLDIQSRRSDAFTDVELRVLQVIANQLATAIQNARLFETQAHNIRENKRLFIESETSLREIQRLNRQLTRQAWEDYLRTEHRVEGVTLIGQEFTNRANWTDTMLQASQRRRAMRGTGDKTSTVAVPIELRGEVIGAIEIEASEGQSSEDIMDMAQAISQRLAVSLDNARLFEEAHEATAQEERISELVSEYQSADSVDDLLKITLTGLAETLGAESAAIRISTKIVDDTTESTNQTTSGDNHQSPNGNS